MFKEMLLTNEKEKADSYKYPVTRDWDEGHPCLTDGVGEQRSQHADDHEYLSRP
jgi:hypothetical protein